MTRIDKNDAPARDGADAVRHVVIVGCGFAGLACAQGLGNRNIRVTVIDQRNYHLFVPLLYQVATAALSPADIAEPIRKVLRRYRNIHVVLGEVIAVDRAQHSLRLADGSQMTYDRLVLATGSSYNYFGHPDWAGFAPGLKTLANAIAIRTGLLLGFEQAESSPDPAEQRRLTTTVIVGGGPTGVEMAGAIAELASRSLREDFRNIDPASARVLLIEAAPRLLLAFPEHLARYAQRRLERIGVDVRLNHPVEQIGPGTVTVGGEIIRANTIIWAAGIHAAPAANWPGVTADRAGRIPVAPDLSVTGIADVFAIGDLALALDDAGDPLPALAQVAKQQGHHLGRQLARQLQTGAPIAPFHFSDRGNTAVIGRSAAVFDFGKQQIKGRLAWMLWAVVHVYLLVGFEKRLLVSLQWFWHWLTEDRGARLIAEDTGHDLPQAPR